MLVKDLHLVYDYSFVLLDSLIHLATGALSGMCYVLVDVILRFSGLHCLLLQICARNFLQMRLIL